MEKIKQNPEIIRKFCQSQYKRRESSGTDVTIDTWQEGW